MLEKYTQKALLAIWCARYEAAESDHRVIENEDLLLGLLRANKRLATRYNMPHDQVREEIRADEYPRSKISRRIDAGHDILLSKSSWEALARAAEQADRLHHPQVGTEQLLWGLYQARDAVVDRIFTKHNVRLEATAPDKSGLAGGQRPINRPGAQHAAFQIEEKRL